MRKVVPWMLVLCLFVSASFVIAEEGDADKKFEVKGDLRLRYERLNNYFDFNNDGAVDTNFDGIPDSRDQFSFIPYRARVGVSGQLAQDVNVVLDIQNVGSWGNESPFKSFHFPPVQNFDGDGNVSAFRTSETSIYQAYVKLNNVWDSGLDFTLGRQEFEFGTGLILGNEDFYNGTTFDGIKGVYNDDAFSITGFYFLTAEREDIANNFFTGFGSNDTDMFGLIANVPWTLGESTKTTFEGYAIDYKDRDEANFEPTWWTFGAHWWRTAATKEDIESNAWDWNLEVAWQNGNLSPRVCQGGANDGLSCLDDTDCTGGACIEQNGTDLGGYLIDASLGYNLTSGDHILRFSAGALVQSGDDDTTDEDSDGWNALYPRSHGRFGNADFFGNNFGSSLFDFGGPIDSGTGFVHGVPPSGITAYHAGINTNCLEGKHLFDATIWWLKPTEDKIDIGAGSDFKVKNFGKEVDLDYAYAYSKNVTLSAGVAYLKPTKGFGQLLGFDDPDNPGQGLNDAVTRFNLGARVRF